ELPRYRSAWRGLCETLVQQRKLTTADIVAESLATQPDLSCESVLFRHEVLCARGNVADAMHEIQAGVERYPHDIDLLRARSRFMFEHGGNSQAISALLDLVRQTPEDGAAHHNLGSAYLRANLLDDAQAAFEESLTVRPNYPLTKRCLEDTLRMQGNADRCDISREGPFESR